MTWTGSLMRDGLFCMVGGATYRITRTEQGLYTTYYTPNELSQWSPVAGGTAGSLQYAKAKCRTHAIDKGYYKVQG